LHRFVVRYDSMVSTLLDEQQEELNTKLKDLSFMPIEKFDTPPEWSLFQAVAKGLKSTKEEVRKKVATWLTNNTNHPLGNEHISSLISRREKIYRTYEEYCQAIDDPKTPGDHLCLVAIAELYKKSICLISAPTDTVLGIGKFEETMYIAHWHEHHFAYLAPPTNLDLVQKQKQDIFEIVIRAEPGSRSHLLQLKDYILEPCRGIQFDFSSTIRVEHYIEELDNGNRVIKILMPDSKLPQIRVDPKLRNIFHVLGTVILPTKGILESSRKTGPWKFTFSVPAGFKFKRKKEGSVTYKDGVVHILLRKVEDSDIVADDAIDE